MVNLLGGRLHDNLYKLSKTRRGDLQSRWDDFGNITIVERPYRDTGTFEVIVRRTMVDEVGRQLRLNRARPIVYVGSGIHASAIYYGFFRDFRLNAENLAEAKLTIEIEGLT